MVLGWLGLLPRVIDAYPEIVLSAGTLYELFEGRQRIRRLQKSRLKRAEQIRDLIAQGRVKVLRVASNPQDALTREIGAELAGLIHAAQASCSSSSGASGWYQRNARCRHVVARIHSDRHAYSAPRAA
jgi:hypothetical protein